MKSSASAELRLEGIVSTKWGVWVQSTSFSLLGLGYQQAEACTLNLFLDFFETILVGGLSEAFDKREFIEQFAYVLKFLL